MSNQMSRDILRVEKLTKKYGDTRAVDDISFGLEEKGFVFINGISGSGKTTLMNIIAGLDSPTSGEVYYKEQNVTRLSHSELDNYRNSEIGIVFQNFNLIEELSVEENLMLPLMIQTITEEQKEILVEEVLNFVGLHGYGKRKGFELSAGQKQRIAIARAIIKRPKVIFADEATGNLDVKNTEQILKLFETISKKCLVVLISHNNVSAKKYADRIITLDEGKIYRDIDNRQLKELYIAPYKITVKGKDYNQEMPLEKFEIHSVIKDFIEKSGKKTKEYFFDTKIILGNDDSGKKDNWSKLEDIKTKRMPFREILKCVLRIMKKNKLKYLLVSSLFAFVILIFSLIAVISFNDYYMSLSQYLENDNQTLYDVKKVVFSDEGEKELQNGKKIYGEMLDLFGASNVVKCIGEIWIENEEELFCATAFKNSNYFQKLDTIGRWPLQTNEVSISKCLANDKNIPIGSYILSDEITYKVVGIYDSKSVFAGHSIVLSKAISAEKLKQSNMINLQACNILKCVDLDEYTSEIVNIGKSSNIQKEDLIWGRMPNNSNELLVSQSILDECGMTLEEGLVTKYRLSDLYDEKYNGQYDCFVNMHDYLGRNVEIVGVFSVDEDREAGDILVQDSAYLEIVDFYNEYLDYETLYASLDANQDSYELTKCMRNKNIYLCDNVCTYIYSIQNFFENMKSVLKTLLLVMLIMLIFVIVSFLSYNVRDYSKTIGIYKSLGIKDIDVAKIFILVNMLLTVLSVMLSDLCLHKIIKFINIQIFAVLESKSYEVFIISKWDGILINLLVIGISLLATIVPVTHMVKKESVTLINREAH